MRDNNVIPQHEPEVIIAIANRLFRGDLEKVATTSLRSLVAHGCDLNSRYHKAHEYETMRCMVDHVPEKLRTWVTSIFCDSKASAIYTVGIRSGCPVEQAHAIARSLEAGAGGHNGIELRYGPAGTKVLSLDPWWPEGLDEL